MMSTVGNSEDFSVNWSVDWKSSKSSGYPWLFGAFYISVCGSILGDPKDQATLNAILACAESWRNLSRTESSDLLFSAPTLEAFLSIEASSYGLNHLESIVPICFVPIPVQANRDYQFDTAESSDNYRLYVLSCNGITRMLFRTNGMPRELVISTDYYKLIVEGAAHGIDRDFTSLREMSR